jgi:hypothetical protein
MNNKSSLSRQDLMAFFQEIMTGEGLGKGEGLPTMEQRMKAASVLMALLEKQPPEDEGVLTFNLTQDQIDQMQSALYHRWEAALKEKEQADVSADVSAS